MPLVSGIHIFMALYGLSVFLETAAHLRKGRRRYIATSFIITAFSALSASLDMAVYFQVLLNSSSGRHWAQLMEVYRKSEGQLVSTAAVGCLLLIADALLVSIVSSF